MMHLSSTTVMNPSSAGANLKMSHDPSAQCSSRFVIVFNDILVIKRMDLVLMIR